MQYAINAASPDRNARESEYAIPGLTAWGGYKKHESDLEWLRLQAEIAAIPEYREHARRCHS